MVEVGIIIPGQRVALLEHSTSFYPDDIHPRFFFFICVSVYVCTLLRAGQRQAKNTINDFLGYWPVVC